MRTVLPMPFFLGLREKSKVPIVINSVYTRRKEFTSSFNLRSNKERLTRGGFSRNIEAVALLLRMCLHVRVRTYACDCNQWLIDETIENRVKRFISSYTNFLSLFSVSIFRYLSIFK